MKNLSSLIARTESRIEELKEFVNLLRDSLTMIKDKEQFAQAILKLKLAADSIKGNFYVLAYLQECQLGVKH